MIKYIMIYINIKFIKNHHDNINEKRVFNTDYYFPFLGMFQ